MPARRRFPEQRLVERTPSTQPNTADSSEAIAEAKTASLIGLARILQWDLLEKFPLPPGKDIRYISEEQYQRIYGTNSSHDAFQRTLGAQKIEEDTASKQIHRFFTGEETPVGLEISVFIREE